MEIKVNDIQALEPVKFNYSELKEELHEKLENYKKMVYTDENMKIAKNDRATLNKLAKAINDEKIRINNKLLEPASTFNEQCKELTAMVKATSDYIDKQVKTFEQKIKDEKLNKITEFFSKNVGAFENIIDFDKIYNEKWLNATYKMKDIESDILHVIKKTEIDFKTLETQFTDNNICNQAKNYYINNIDNEYILTLAISEGNKIIESNKKLEELKQKEEASKNAIDVEQKNAIYIPVTANEERFTLPFAIKNVTKSQILALRKFCEENNITLCPVEKQNKTLILNYSESYDNDIDSTRSQEISNNEEKIMFSVHNLYDCPEDAIIDRDLFNADDYIETLEKGMKLAEKGYTEIEIKEIKEEEEE